MERIFPVPTSGDCLREQYSGNDMAKKNKNANRIVDILIDYLHDANRSGINDIPIATDKGGPRWALNAVNEKPLSAAAADSVVRSGPDSSSPLTGPSSPLPPSQPIPGDVMARSSNKVVLQDIPVYEEVEAVLRDADHQDKATILSRLAHEVSQCRRCQELVDNRTQTVFGTGNLNAALVFIGEGPGADEDRQGVPFVGRSGQLLTNIITAGMKLSRQDVYICNIVRCRPPGNRTPLDSEALCCRPFLDATIKVIAPQYICCLGSVAARNLLGTNETIGSLRGKVHDYHGIKVVCTYHPAYLLRNPPAKAQTWEDIKLLMREMKLL